MVNLATTKQGELQMKKILNKLAVVGLAVVSTVTLAHNHTKDEYQIGSIKIESPYTRSTVPGQKAAGGFLKIQNSGPTDQLISASSPAGVMELHTMVADGNVMKMREVKAIEVPNNGSVELKPGGLHLMFFDIKAPFKAGESVPVKLKFQKAGEVEIKLPVRDISGNSGHSKH
jgi:periplasmic copper chaperone A